MNRRGIELALHEINARPERYGSPLHIDFQDDDGSGQVASGIAQHFVDSKDLVAVVGHASSAPRGLPQLRQLVAGLRTS